MKSNLYLLILVSLLNASNILAQNNLKAQTVYDLIYEGKLNLAFDKVNKLDESNEKHYLKGKLFRLMGKYDEAINSYNQIIKEDNFTDLANQELIDIYTPYLKKINNKFDKDWILEHKFNKINYAQPIIPVNYSKIKIPLKLSINGLYSGNTAQIYPEDRGTNYAVDLGNKITNLIIKS